MKSNSLRLLLALSVFACATAAQADDPVFSGPQEGERLADFKALEVLDKEGESFSFMGEAKDGPVFLIFVHKITRPSIGLIRTLMNDAAARKSDGLTSGVIFLSDDTTAMQAQVKRMSHALPTSVRLGISPDKQEGPGAYGLNRNVSLTILVGQKQKVTANFAIVQPSIQADAVKVLSAVVKAVGKGKAPTLGQLTVSPVRDPILRKPLDKLLDVDGKDRDVKAIVKEIDDYVGEKPQAKRALSGIAGRLAMVVQDKKYEDEVRKAVRRWSQRKGAADRGRMSDKLSGLIRSVIQKTATDEQVDKANKALEAHLKENAADRREVGRIATTITSSGKLGNYGTPHAQEIIKGWAKKYGARRER